MQTIKTVGRRKTSVARVCLIPGNGDIKINKRPLHEYFPLEFISDLVKQPFDQIQVANQYDVKVRVVGGGFRGQAEAIRLGVARALCKLDGTFKPILKEKGMLRRDSRKVERKHYGHKKARRGFQFTKR